MTWDLRGKVVLITGASAGIGRAAALEFDRLGARVAMAARRRERLEENAARMTDALILQADMADLAQVERMVDDTIAHYGRLDVLVNNAGETRIERTEDMDIKDFHRLLNVNFLSAVVATKRAVPQMWRQGGGHVVNVSSPAGLHGTPFNGTYSATKGAMCGWTRVMQGEWAGTGVTLTEYHPGLVATEMGSAAKFGPGIGELPQSIPTSKGGWLSRLGSRSLTADRVGAHVVDCVVHRRPIAFSTRGATLVMHLAQFASIRKKLGTDRAGFMRQRLGIRPLPGQQARHGDPV